MASNETTISIQAFLDSYRAAFERLDARDIAEHFAYSSHITSDADDVAFIPLAARQDCVRAVEKVLTLHRQLGAPSGRIVELWPRSVGHGG